MAFRSLDDMYDKWEKTAQGVGNPSDAEVPSGNGSAIGILKAVRTMVGSALVTLGSAIGSKAQLMAGSDGTNARAIKTASDGTVLTQLTGSKAQQKEVVTIANAVALTGTTATIVNVPNWNNYNRHVIFALNSHDQRVAVDIISYLRAGGDILNVSVQKTAQTVEVPANGAFAPIMITSSELAALNGIQPDNVAIRYRAVNAPSTGSVTIKVVMWAE